MAGSTHEKMMRLHKQGDGSKDSRPELLSYEVALKDKQLIARDTYAFAFEKPKGFQLTAGQHIHMTLLDPPETDDEGNSRFWTLASTPSNKDLVIAMRMRDTAFKRVLGSMSIGTKVSIQMRKHSHTGAFILHEDTTKPAVFLAGGIGIVPAYSIIKDALERKLSHKLMLFYSNRRPEDAPYLSELKALSKQYRTFKLIATMTESEKSAKVWHGETGRINEAMLKRYVNDLQSPIYYVAGLPDMVKAMRASLTGLGIAEDNTRAEEFAGFIMNHNKDAAMQTIKNRIALVLIALAVITMVIVNGVAGLAIFHSSQGPGLLKNPIIYLVVGFIIGIAVMFKLKLVTSFKHGRKQ